MSPTFLPDAYVLSVKHPWQRLKDDDVILLSHATYGNMIKRILKKTDDALLVVGDNPQSVTTEQMGLIPYHDVLGKVLWHSNPTPKHHRK